MVTEHCFPGGMQAFLVSPISMKLFLIPRHGWSQAVEPLGEQHPWDCPLEALWAWGLGPHLFVAWIFFLFSFLPSFSFFNMFLSEVDFVECKTQPFRLTQHMRS